MEDWETTQEALKTMKNDINDLKDKMSQIHGLKDQLSQILEVLTILDSRRDATTRHEGVISSHPTMSQTQHVNTQGTATPFPQYGLPPGYTPPTEESPDQMTLNTQGIGENVIGTTTVPHTTTQPQVLQILTGEPSSAKVNIPEDIQNALISVDKTKVKLEILEERLRVIEGASAREFGDAAGLCLVPNIGIPPKFKVPGFEKYKGATCPKSHLTMYCRKMAAHAHNEKLLMHLFQDSLAGTALNWYMHLEPARVRSWKDLVDAFLK